MKTTAGAIFLACAGMVSCNTEIVNLPLSPALELPLKPNPTWPVISTLPNLNSGLFEIHPVALDEDSSSSSSSNSSIPSPHDLWLVLEIDEWKKSTAVIPHSFTLRLSWPASMAVDFDITLFTPPAPHSDMNSAVNPPSHSIQYVRLRAYSTGVRVRRPSPSPLVHEIAQFNLILEPLLLGVIPRSIVPTLLFLFAVVGFSSWLVPRVLTRLCHVAEEAKAEADGKRQ